MPKEIEEDVLDAMPIEPWSGPALPWNDPEFSARMLRGHLSQEHDEYSRRVEIVARHVEWIHNDLLERKISRILDLGCGPGLYSERLAMLGHKCVGIDFSPASIRYAKDRAEEKSLSCAYVEGDIRTVDYGGPFDQVLFVYGEFNAFPVKEAEKILRKSHNALVPGGMFVLEACRLEFLMLRGVARTQRLELESGTFSDQPHSRILDMKWFQETKNLVERNIIIDAKTEAVSQYMNTLQGYTEDEYTALLERAGFAEIEKRPSFGYADAERRPIDWSWTFCARRPA